MMQYPILFRLAARNVRRQARRNLLTALAMVVGLALLILSRSLADGTHEDWIESGVRMGSGHIAFQSPEFRTHRNIKNRLSASDIQAARAALERTAPAGAVMEEAERFEVQALANSAAAAQPILVVGVVPEVERHFSQMDRHTQAGEYLQPTDDRSAFIGRELATRLHLDVGDRLVLTGQDVSGTIAWQLVRVRGIFATGVTEVDLSMVQVPITTVRQWLGTGDDATSLAVLLEASRQVNPLVASLRKVMAGQHPNIGVFGWREVMPELDAAVRLDDYGDYVFHGILFLIAGIAVVNTVLMSVLYRVREFGLLRALGLTKTASATLVFTEGVLLTGISGVVGVLLGWGVTWLFFRNGLDISVFMREDFTFAGIAMDPVMMPMFRVAQFVQSFLFIAAIGVVASLYPAYRAAKIEMAGAMKFQE
jgi:putative ABC transport system permease protein